MDPILLGINTDVDSRISGILDCLIHLVKINTREDDTWFLDSTAVFVEYRIIKGFIN